MYNGDTKKSESLNKQIYQQFVEFKDVSLLIVKNLDDIGKL